MRYLIIGLGLTALMCCFCHAVHAQPPGYRIDCSNGVTCKLVPIGPAYSQPSQQFAPRQAYNPPGPTYSTGTIVGESYFEPAADGTMRYTGGWGVQPGVPLQAPMRTVPVPVAVPVAVPVRQTFSTCGNPRCPCGFCRCWPVCLCR